MGLEGMRINNGSYRVGCVVKPVDKLEPKRHQQSNSEHNVRKG